MDRLPPGSVWVQGGGVERRESGTVEYVVDTITYQPVSISTKMLLMIGGVLTPERDPEVQVFEGVQDVEGLHLPARDKSRGPLAFVVNPRLDDGLFSTSPDGVADRNAWRKFLK